MVSKEIHLGKKVLLKAILVAAEKSHTGILFVLKTFANIGPKVMSLGLVAHKVFRKLPWIIGRVGRVAIGVVLVGKETTLDGWVLTAPSKQVATSRLAKKSTPSKIGGRVQEKTVVCRRAKGVVGATAKQVMGNPSSTKQVVGSAAKQVMRSVLTVRVSTQVVACSIGAVKGVSVKIKGMRVFVAHERKLRVNWLLRY